MYFDNRTLLLLLLYAIAFGCYAYVCIIRDCINDMGMRKREKRNGYNQR